MKKVTVQSLVLSLVLVSPLFADEIRKDDPLSQCYQETSNITNDIHQAMSECLTNKLADSKKIMDAAFGQTKASLEGIDSVESAGAVAALEKSQTAFTLYRDTECERRAEAMMGGTGSGSVLLACQVELNNWRSDQLSNQ